MNGNQARIWINPCRLGLYFSEANLRTFSVHRVKQLPHDLTHSASIWRSSSKIYLTRITILSRTDAPEYSFARFLAAFYKHEIKLWMFRSSHDRQFHKSVPQFVVNCARNLRKLTPSIIYRYLCLLQDYGIPAGMVFFGRRVQPLCDSAALACWRWSLDQLSSC